MPQDSSTTYQIEDLKGKIDDLKSDLQTTKIDIHKFATELAIIKNDYSKILEMLTRINDNFDKMYTMVNNLSNNGTSNEVTTKFLKEELTSTKNRVIDLERKYEGVSRWMWVATGAGAVLGFLLDSMVRLFK